MEEIVKADKQYRNRAYIFFACLVLIPYCLYKFWLPSYESSKLDGLSIEEEILAMQYLWFSWVVAGSGGIIAWLILAFEYFRCGRRVLAERRFPPTGSKVITDTKVIYEKVAVKKGRFMIMNAIMVPLALTIFCYFFYYGYSLQMNILYSIQESNQKSNKLYSKLVAKNPFSVEAVHYHFMMRNQTQAVDLLARLIQTGDDEALYAQASESLIGKKLPQEFPRSIQTLSWMCKKYVEPCLALAIHYKEQKQYKQSSLFFDKAASKDYVNVYRERRYLYNRLYMNDRAKLDEYTEKMNAAKSHMCDGIYCLTRH